MHQQRTVISLVCIFLGNLVWSPCASGAEPLAEIRIVIDYAQFTTSQVTPAITVSLLDDMHDLSGQIDALQEASKQELEPLVKDYMYVAEALMQLSAKTRSASPQKTQLVERFSVAEEQIAQVLASYREPIAALIQEKTLRNEVASQFQERLHMSNIPPGKYRLYVECSFSTTTLRWFEPIFLKGGDSYSVLLTRDNLKNPYWTDLDWWSFMNLDFSKHHLN